MTSISYTAPCFSERDDKRERDSLSKEERLVIINDMYGNNNTNGRAPLQHRDNGANAIFHSSANVAAANNNDNDDAVDNNDNNNNVAAIGDDDSDITQALLDEFELELDLIPEGEKLDYTNALVEAPAIIFETECHPKRFLRCENYNAERAARRLVQYWEMRCDVFFESNDGRTKPAFQPMTIDGAMKNDLDLMLAMPRFVQILPNDATGRTVICVDRTSLTAQEIERNAAAKVFWFIMHIALQNTLTQKKGAVFIVVNRSQFDFIHLSALKQLIESRTHCIPVKTLCIHACTSSIINKIRLPCVKLFMSKDARQRLIVHTSPIKSIVLGELQTYGLSKESLPPTVGGTYESVPFWVIECRRIIDHRNLLQRRRRNKRERYMNNSNDNKRRRMAEGSTEEATDENDTDSGT